MHTWIAGAGFGPGYFQDDRTSKPVGYKPMRHDRILIFNRWGNEVYKANPYQGDWNGSNLGEGTYYYIFDLRLHTGHWQTFKGFVTIIRNKTN